MELFETPRPPYSTKGSPYKLKIAQVLGHRFWEQVGTTEIQLPCCHQVAELLHVDEAPNHRILIFWLKLVGIGFYGHKTTGRKVCGP
jgi:hypothetical protein